MNKLIDAVKTKILAETASFVYCKCKKSSGYSIKDIEDHSRYDGDVLISGVIQCNDCHEYTSFEVSIDFK